MTEKHKDFYEIMGIEAEDRTNVPTSNVPVRIDQPKEPSKVPAIIIEKTEEESEFEKDFNESRNNMLFLIEQARIALGEVAPIAREKEGAAEYMAFNNLLRTVGDASIKLLRLHENKKKFMQREPKKDENGIQVKNAVFVGSSTDLRKMLESHQTKANN